MLPINFKFLSDRDAWKSMDKALRSSTKLLEAQVLWFDVAGEGEQVGQFTVAGDASRRWTLRQFWSLARNTDEVAP